MTDHEQPAPARTGFFTRILEDAPAADRYRFALEQIETAERFGHASAWVAQHHFHEHEGGLPSPFVLLAAAASRTSTIALATGVVTLPIDDPLRAAEDASVLDAISGGRVQLGVAAGGTPSSFPPFGRDAADRRTVFADHLDVFTDALAGRGIRGTDATLYPPADGLVDRLWEGTFSVGGGTRAGAAGHGLMLSRSQPRPDRTPDLLLHDLQLPIVDAYRAALPQGAPYRVLASRSAVVVDEPDRTRVLEEAEPHLRRFAATIVGPDRAAELDLDGLVRVTDTHVGTVDEVVASLARDETLTVATDVTFQVHSVEPRHETTLRSIELLATEVAPRLGLATGPDAAAALRDAHRTRTRTPERTA
ncbi:putative FMN-dependent luciferase-like monooxygenase [Curtobacterium sp. NPDC089991]|uniref:putative FMN-dependent luciferase-like monooxygenase n=1 Tax=Curtobacterium sp. NPDC089991 TaxID=3363969 RepID=UPI003822E058